MTNNSQKIIVYAGVCQYCAIGKSECENKSFAECLCWQSNSYLSEDRYSSAIDKERDICRCSTGDMEFALVGPATCYRMADQYLCLQCVGSCPFDEDYVPTCMISPLPFCVVTNEKVECCMEAPPCPILDKDLPSEPPAAEVMNDRGEQQRDPEAYPDPRRRVNHDPGS